MKTIFIAIALAISVRAGGREGTPRAPSGLAAWPKSQPLTFCTRNATPYTGPVFDQTASAIVGTGTGASRMATMRGAS